MLQEQQGPVCLERRGEGRVDESLSESRWRPGHVGPGGPHGQDVGLDHSRAGKPLEGIEHDILYKIGPRGEEIIEGEGQSRETLSISSRTQNKRPRLLRGHSWCQVQKHPFQVDIIIINRSLFGSKT